MSLRNSWLRVEGLGGIDWVGLEGTKLAPFTGILTPDYNEFHEILASGIASRLKQPVEGIQELQIHLWTGVDYRLFRFMYDCGVSSFEFTLWEAIIAADSENSKKLAKGFPEEVEAYHRYTSEPLYCQHLISFMKY